MATNLIVVGGNADYELIQKHSEQVPIDGAGVSLLEEYFWSEVSDGAAEGLGDIVVDTFLGEAEVGEPGI